MLRFPNGQGVNQPYLVVTLGDLLHKMVPDMFLYIPDVCDDSVAVVVLFVPPRAGGYGDPRADLPAHI